MGIRCQRLLSYLLIVSMLSSGCLGPNRRELHYIGDAELEYYKDTAQSIDYPNYNCPSPDQVLYTDHPRTILDRSKDEIRDITLMEAIHHALAENSIVRRRIPRGNQFAGLGFSSPVLTNPNGTSTIYDPAIQESGVLFGGIGIEAALAAFDAQLTASMLWGRDERAQNNSFTGGGVGALATLVTETGQFRSGLQKQFASGGVFGVNHNWNYLGINTSPPGQAFKSAYTGLLSASYRHPVLAGAGTEFTRIAGPIAQGFRGITGVNQGVVIARINNDLSVADFQRNVRNLLKDVEDAYWSLYLSYRIFDTAVTQYSSALQSWREAKFILDVGGREGFQPADEAQARDFLFETRAQKEGALADIFADEAELRRLLGLPVNDGFILRPSDEPVTAQLIPDWEICLTECLARRIELRQQKWNVKSLELQLKAANSLTRPRLDFVSEYRVNGLGDRLLSSQDNRGNFRTGYGALTQGDQTGWGLGFEMTMPFGFRQAHAQVTNVELRLAKARGVLGVQEMEVSHELADAFQAMARNYVTAQSHFNRALAANRRAELFEAEVREGTKTLDDLLRAQASLAAAKVAYYTSVVQYNQAIAYLHLAKGTLFDYNNVHLAEGAWTPKAYADACEKAWARSHAMDADWLETVPEEFVIPGFSGTVGPMSTPSGTSGLPQNGVEEVPPSPAPAAEPLDELPMDTSEGGVETSDFDPFLESTEPILQTSATNEVTAIDEDFFSEADLFPDDNSDPFQAAGGNGRSVTDDSARQAALFDAETPNVASEAIDPEFQPFAPSGDTPDPGNQAEWDDEGFDPEAFD